VRGTRLNGWKGKRIKGVETKDFGEKE